MATKTIEIRLEALNEAAFHPYGEIVGEGAAPPVFEGIKLKSWRLDYGVDGATELMFARYGFQAWQFTRLERHFNVTQCFLPLGGRASIMVVAAPTERHDPTAIPEPETVRAFYLVGERGILLWRGTWHALDRFAVRPPHVDFALITGRETQAELERQSAGGAAPELTQAVDYLALRDTAFTVIDADGLAAGA